MGRPPPVRFVPTEADRIGSLTHVAYEMEQIRDLLSTFPREQGLQMNAWLEALLIHVRLLLDFFEYTRRSVTKGQENDDVLACDYGFPASHVEISTIFRERLNKDLAHLSYSRQKRLGAAKQWDVRDLSPLLVRCREFAEHVCENWADKVSPDVRARWAQLVQWLET